MRKSYLTFPAGKFAIGLLILRMAAGIPTCCFGGALLGSVEFFTKDQISPVSHLILGLLLIIGSIFVMLGFITRFVSIMVAICELIAAVLGLPAADMIERTGFSGTAVLLLLATIAIALAFLGPGALSIDSRRYGLQRIFIPSSEKEERKGS